MIGLENIKNKKLRIFKEDNRIEMKNFHTSSGNLILVMGQNLAEAFAISYDGDRKVRAAIVGPENDYLQWATHARVKNELFIFGGRDRRKVRKLKKL